MADPWYGLMGRAGRAVFALVACAGLMFAPACGDSAAPTKPLDAVPLQTDAPKTQAVVIKGRAFDLELALDDASREQGLSDRKSIAENGGMLFVFPAPRRVQFVMRRCYVPIDLIYIDEKGYVDSMHRMEVIEPVGGPVWKNPSTGYASAGRVQFVIELRGGTLDTLGLRRGEKIELPSTALQSKAQ